MVKQPLMKQDDFTQLLISGARSYLIRVLGTPSDIGLDADLTGVRWKELLPQGCFREFENTVLQFFGLEEIPTLEPNETPVESGSRLWEQWRNGPRIIVFHTSGSSGKSIPCPHPETFLWQEATAVTDLFPRIRRVVCTTPPYHSYSFVFGFLMPKLKGLRRLELPPQQALLEERLATGDLLVSFPLFLQKIRTPPPKGVHCLSSTAPCPPALFTDLERLGFAGMIEIYGSTETGAVASRSSGHTPFILLPHWSKGDADHLLRKNPMGYGEEQYMLPDHATWREDRELLPAGRRDRSVKVGGTHVFPDKVAAVIQTNPMVEDCTVRQMRSEEGERLKAFIVLKHGVDPITARSSLKRFFREKFDAVERPGSITFGHELPQSETGKSVDWGLGAK